MKETLSVHRCPQCGAPASARPKKCEYCEAEFVVTSLASLGSFGKAGLQKYVAHYNEGLKAEPDNADIHQAKGICFLELGMFDFAAKSLDRAIELNPENPDTYYYRAVALVKGRKPRLLSLNEIKAVDENLAAAATIERWGNILNGSVRFTSPKICVAFLNDAISSFASASRRVLSSDRSIDLATSPSTSFIKPSISFEMKDFGLPCKDRWRSSRRESK